MTNPNESESVDKQIDTYLSDRRKRVLEDAKMAELEHVAEDEKTQAARSRKERELVEGGKVNPIKGEEVTMEDTEKRVEEAAEVAAEAASIGLSPEEAKNLGTGKSKVVVVKPESKEPPTEGGWSVIDGKPMKDPEGEYTFSQALKVAALEKSKGESDPMAIFAWLKKEGMLEGGKGDEFMKTFTAELAKQSVENIVKPPRSDDNSAIGVLRGELSSLREELKKATDPIEAANRVKSIYDGFKSVGLISESAGGTSLEQLKETHRHDEKMEDIKTERAYKEKLGEVVSDLPERVGRGIAGQIGEGEGSSNGGGELESIACECGQKIYISPDTGPSVTCPKCSAVYSRKVKGEGE